MTKPMVYGFWLLFALVNIAIQSPTKEQLWFSASGFFVGWWANELLSYFFPNLNVR